MAWQAEVGSGSARATSQAITGNRITWDYVTKLVAILTSQHVQTVAINAAGTGWTTGDVATLTHAGAFLDARFEVTAVAGAITALRIISSGAFSNRVATVAIGATAGTGYAANEIVEITTGTSREKCKVKIDTAPGGVPATISLYETGGAYSVAPGASNNATRGIGPSTFGGDDALTINVTMTGLTGLTGLTVTGPGSGATVDITLEETGWTVDDDATNPANTNSHLYNSLDGEKIVRLVADATGFTNKPYVFIMTGTETVALDTRHFVAFLGSISHNRSQPIDSQTGRSAGFSSGSFANGGSYILFAQNEANDADFWVSADVLRFVSVVNENPSASTDDARYFQAHAGFIDRHGTETEDPFPYVIFGSSRDRDANPASASDEITSIAECRALSTGPGYVYRVEAGAWTDLKNNQADTPSPRDNIVIPFGEVEDFNESGDAEYIGINADTRLSSSFIQRNRGASTEIIQLVPGTTPKYFRIPLAVISWNSSNHPSGISDFPRGEFRGLFFVYNTDAAGNAIANFSEDFLTDGTERYRVFHNHVHTDRYQFIAVHEDVN